MNEIEKEISRCIQLYLNINFNNRILVYASNNSFFEATTTIKKRKKKSYAQRELLVLPF